MYVSNIKRLDLFRRRSTWLFPKKHSEILASVSESLIVQPSSSSIIPIEAGDAPRRGGPGQTFSRTVQKALRRLEKCNIALTRDTREYPPNGEWTDHTFKITNEFGFPFIFITAEVVRSCFCRRKRIDYRVMTPEGQPICLMHGRISIGRYLKIMFERPLSGHGRIVQPGFRPYYILKTSLGIPLYRIEPDEFSESTCYAWTDLPTEYLVFTMDGFERNAKAATRWERYKLPHIYAKDIYKRTSIYGVAFHEETALDAWQRLLIIGLHMTLKIIHGEFFYDQQDFVTGYGHPERVCCDKYGNYTKSRPKIDPETLSYKYYTSRDRYNKGRG